MGIDWSSRNQERNLVTDDYDILKAVERRSWREPKEALSTHRGIQLPFDVRKTAEGILLLVVVFVVVPVLWTVLRDVGRDDEKSITQSAAALTVPDETATTDNLTQDVIAPGPVESEVPTPSTGEPPTAVAPTVTEPPDVEPPVTTEPSVVAPAPEDVPPFADMSGSSFDTTTREFFRFVTYLKDHPDPVLVDTIFQRDTPAWAHFKHDIEVLASSGSDGVHQAATVRSVRVVSSSASRVVVNAVTTYADGPALVENVVFLKQPDGTWRVSDHTVKDV